MATKFPIEIITPDKVFLQEDIERIVVRTVDGDIGILNNHAPLITSLEIGRMKIYFDDNNIKESTVNGGVLMVENKKAIILTDSAEWIEEIDRDRAEEALRRAKERLNRQREEKIDSTRADIALKKAVNRIKLKDNK